MENTATLFNTRYVVDSIEDRSYTNVNAHELAHQWFGNLVTESGKHHWLQEGLLPLCVAGRKGNLW
jgi:aminopeptidase N